MVQKLILIDLHEILQFSEIYLLIDYSKNHQLQKYHFDSNGNLEMFTFLLLWLLFNLPIHLVCKGSGRTIPLSHL